MDRSESAFRKAQYDHDRACPPDEDYPKRAELVERGTCPDCGGHGCDLCLGTGNAPRCIQCGLWIDTRRAVRANETYCPPCAAVEIEQLYQGEARLEAEVARLKKIIEDTATKIGQMAESVTRL